ncbi:uncharacterized protein DUF4432 [Rhizobium sp. PP-CC-2G-626]|nr:uncharacterized protein DUF4432 [Rhizobium sp. PP-CC-2G-626]
MRMDGSHDGKIVTLLLDPASAMDVAALVVDGIDLSPGHAIPSDGDPRIDQALKGFLFTCGPDHIRHPEPTANGGRYPLHGSLSGTQVPTETLTATESMCLAIVDIRLVDGGRARLTRRWSMTQGAVHLEDRIENIGGAPFPPMWMYHLNIAGRFFDGNTRIRGDMVPDGSQGWRFGDGESAHVLFPAVADDGWARVGIGPFPALGHRILDIRFKTDSLPFLQMWRCQRGDADVVSIEPVSHRIAKRSALSESGALSMLMPGEAIAYELLFGLIDDASSGKV